MMRIACALIAAAALLLASATPGQTRGFRGGHHGFHGHRGFHGHHHHFGHHPRIFGLRHRFGHRHGFFGLHHGFRHTHPFGATLHFGHHRGLGWPPVVLQEPPVYVESPAAATQAPPPATPTQNYWYYCKSSGAYYPNVPWCPEPWIKVPPRPE